MFTLPKRLAQNLNLDICVVDYTDKESNSRLLVITATGKVRFIYNGQSSLQRKFAARDVCCDNRGRILVVDLHNNAVHLLREDGEFLQYVLTELNELRGPRCLAMYEDTLWVGCRKGLVKVYRYYEDIN
ncbi:hypothetical protein FSP39_002153 [Pinctada imbricata]|uniref:Uncharacterized protein n=1 Tax=Pinctada imbricata TaxID=66713 RepID=A0AA89BZP6_PINIB|nr:hypothetical protein FSP39_002153 [Pinctada imbricata]